MVNVKHGGNAVKCVTYSPCGDTLVVGYFNGEVKIINAENGCEIASLNAHNSSVISVCYGSDGKYIASADFAGIIKIWELKYGKEIAQFVHNDEKLTNTLFRIVFSPDGQYISSGRERAVKIWDIKNNEKIREFNEPEYPVISLAYSHNGQYIACGDDDGKIRVWNTTHGELLYTADANIRNHISSVNFSPDDKYLVSGAWDGSIKLWNVIDGSEIIELEGHKQRNANCAYAMVKYSPNGKYLVSGSRDGTLKLWSAETYEHLKTFIPLKNWQAIEQAIEIEDGVISYLVEFPSEDYEEEMRAEFSGIDYVEFSPDSQKILILDQKGVIKIWNIIKNEIELKIIPILDDLAYIQNLSKRDRKLIDFSG